MEKDDLVRVFVKGGIISPGDFLKMIQTASDLGATYIHLGSRQDVLFPLKNKNLETLANTFQAIDTAYDTDGEEFQNIVSSFPALDVMPTTHWLASHTYHYILDTFDYRPKLKINIIDPVQNLVPLFTGNINFVASDMDNYWYLFLRFSEIDAKPWSAPDLIYGYDLSKVAKAIEDIKPVQCGLKYEEIYRRIKASLSPNTQKAHHDLDYPEANSPYYEGMNRIVGGKYWLGLYWRNNKFTINFLKALCQLCLSSNIGKICLTPWKSIIIKGIAEKDRLSWEKLLGKFGINIRHSSLELNWHLPVLDQEAMEIKNYLVRALDKQDISTYGLSFSVKTRHMALFTSVAIEKAKKKKETDPDMFNILYSKDFNPNLSEYFYFVKNVPLETLPPLLIELSHKYYDQLEIPKSSESAENNENLIKKPLKKYQCSSCLTVYDEQYGDPASEILPGTSFLTLPDSYTCPLCENPKSAFKRIDQ
ncbi:Nitrite/Sulfite reductase ferredoxin-like half domain-containing protein [Cyclobacterium lianum]|uniref:Nitrite/Sulfite reductase ferredoxin-like half domain-containing protein n=1 Tax=Cyclobacterium lianum TaxID=388280 RepID=A0A1M7QK16_9BACT|nr:rubredoxin [Cyclobacterium lianum]SHN31392.1 Nitrite/Sulfite reductase ferredoxin-like half domain-containing protein [Cyclobacterium lianum]